ncbi:hypothetical protein SAMN05421833_12095 [Microbispora rosea]|uniref:Uncharacterized protein n=1 Tax=Microbispora rosea TaxID=58117 RepID=A0A1N7F3A0_9ACTN|nr:hypothetical protein SAMN05421833_12095 [Microbispora rosea]
MRTPCELPAQLVEQRQQCRAAHTYLPPGRDLRALVRRPGRPQRMVVGQQHVDVGEQLVEGVDEPALRVVLRRVAVQVLHQPGERPAEVTADDLPRLLLAYGLLLAFGRAGVDRDVPRVDLGQVVDQRVPGDPARVQGGVDQRGETDRGQAQGEGVLRVVLLPGDVLRRHRGPFDRVRREYQFAHEGHQSVRADRGAGVFRVVPRHRAALALFARTRPRRFAHGLIPSVADHSSTPWEVFPREWPREPNACSVIGISAFQAA